MTESCRRGQLSSGSRRAVAYYAPPRPEPILEKVVLTCEPSQVRIRITTMAIRTRMRAYSTRPWPFFFNCSILARIRFASIYERKIADKIRWCSIAHTNQQAHHTGNLAELQ